MAYDSTTHDPVAFNSKMNWGNVFERSYATPLDRTSLFESYEDAEKYAKGQADSRNLGGTSYPGQVIAVLTGGNNPTVYVIRGGTITGGVENKSERELVQLGQQSESGAEIYWLNDGGSPIT